MVDKHGIAISAVVILALASTALAKDAGPPRLDVEYACRASEKAVSAVVSVTTDIFKSCLDDENAARDQLDRGWAKFPASDRSRCIHPSEFLPSYVEWLTCLEMTRDVREMRKGRPGATSSDLSECPLVRYLDDGTITSVQTAC